MRSLVTCGVGQFSCDGHCVPLKWKCDGETDCADGSDELSFCARCGSDEFRCQSGRCLPKSYLCDGTPDCGINGVDDNSDEDPSICKSYNLALLCEVFTRQLVRQISIPVSMRHVVFTCRSSCNGIADCNDHF
ncbi:Low-density lipoprotein receptor domain class A [Ostertagia ostertagi]